MAIRRAFQKLCQFVMAGLCLISAEKALNAATLSWNPNPEPDIAGYKVFWGETNTTPNVRDVGNVTATQITDLAPGSTYFFYLTAYNTAGLESSPSTTIYHTPSGPPPVSVANSASYVGQDAATSGSWRGVYGKDGGVVIPAGILAYPEYVALSALRNYPLTWATSTTDSRALQMPYGGGRFAGAWHSTDSLEFYFRFADSATYQVSFYFVDFDRKGRQQMLELFDLATGRLLGAEMIADFENGVYSTWNLKGDVGARITALEGPDCVLSGVFFDPLAAASATFVSLDNATSGSWIGNYGTEGGLAYPLGHVVPPSYVQIGGYQNQPLTWSANTSNTRALQKPGSSGRFAGAWHSDSELYFFLQFKDTATHQVSFYFVDYDRAGRQQRLEIFDHASGNRIASTTVSNFGNGVYYSYNLKGNVRVKLTRIAGPDAVLSALLFDPAGPNHAHFVEADTATSGSWRGVYGGDGQSIAMETASLPDYASVELSGAIAGYWNPNTSDPTALQRPSGSSRIASTWFAASQFSASVSLSDGGGHALSLYFVDFNNQGRVQLVEIIDPQTGVALDSTELTNFRSGVWLSYDIIGDVVVRVTSLNNRSPVLSGFFFD